MPFHEDGKFKNVLECGNATSKVIACAVDVLRGNIVKSADCHAQQYMLMKVLPKFGYKVNTAVISDFLPKNRRGFFKSADVKYVPLKEMRRERIFWMLVIHNSDGTTKTINVYNPKPARYWIITE